MYAKFLVEGDKTVTELLHSGFKIDAIYALPHWIEQNKNLTATFEVHEVTETELQKISTHENPDAVLAVACIPEQKKHTALSAKGLYLVLDNISDPGNAGTMIRTAEWFGVEAVILSNNSVDIYNPKVVSAAKGSLFRLTCFYDDLENLLTANAGIPVYGTFMQGDSVYTQNLSVGAFVLIGNEANGISPALVPFIQHKISIPSSGAAESLNAAVAAGIILSEFRRGNIA